MMMGANPSKKSRKFRNYGNYFLAMGCRSASQTTLSTPGTDFINVGYTCDRAHRVYPSA